MTPPRFFHKLVRVDQSPTNSKVWCLELSCGHSFFRPGRKPRLGGEYRCTKCAAGPADALHFKRTAGTLDELSYAPCGAGIASFGAAKRHLPPIATSNADDVTCVACQRWLRETGRLSK